MLGGSKPVLLAIDDDAIILNTVISTLKRDYSVRPFTSGETALKYLTAQTADLILLDNKMPGMNGFEVLKELQATPRLASIPTIFLTGSMDGESEVEALELGAVDYIHKPVKPQALLTRVRLQLELQSHRKHLEALVEEKTIDLNRAYRKLETREDLTLNLLARVTDLRDHETGGHIERTTEFVRVMTEFIRENPQPDYLLTPVEAADIIKSAKLHDQIG
ncbi:MAG: response regulator, partial [Candidatus Adiutrix sp.]|nr:response regulator [Candidatus Adiutrix sp.]